MVGLDPIALTGRFFSVLAAPRRALLRPGGGFFQEPGSGDIVEPGARAPGLRLAPWQPSPGGATPGAGMEHRGGWSARRCRPRWGPGKWMIRVVLGLMPQALRSRPASGAQKRLTSNVGRTRAGGTFLPLFSTFALRLQQMIHLPAHFLKQVRDEFHLLIVVQSHRAHVNR